MYYPNLQEAPMTRDLISYFRGYNHNMRIGKGEFYDMENMTSSSYPLLSPRNKRGFYTGGGSICAMIAKDQLCYVDGTAFVIGTDRVEMGLSTGEKSLVSMGAYVIILPDKKYINTVDTEDRGNIESAMTTIGPVSFSLCQLTGEPFDVTVTADQEPEDIENTKYWMDTGTTPNVLKQYSKAAGMWVSIPTTYIRISSYGIGVPFQKGDGVTISGLKDTQLMDNATGEAFEDGDLAAIDGSFVVMDRGDDFLIITGMLGNARTISNSLSVKRAMPELDFCIESGNRLWGCRYGVGADGKAINEIYASKLGDFKNWSCFQGVSTDSYVASCGTDGPWTGAITHMGYPLFFKEDVVHKVYGQFPANFQIQDTACRGVQKGSHKSLAIVGEILYYKSRLGVCAYDGSLPTEISQALGDIAYARAVAGSHGSKYYINMMDSAGVYHLFVYDAAKNMWHREDNVQVKTFCSFGNEMYYLDAKDGQIKTILGSGTSVEGAIHWMAQTGLMCVDDPDKKYISRIQIRLQMELESTVDIYIEYDSSGRWEKAGTMRGTRLGSVNLPVRPKRCDHMRLKIEGVGPARIFSICKNIEQGSGY